MFAFMAASIVAVAPLAASAGAQWEGNYTAKSNWDTIDVEIHRTHYNQLRVNLSVGAKDGCVGELEFLAPVPRGEVLFLFPRQREPITDQESGDKCNLTLNKVGNILIVNENECSKEHGAACTFDGRLHSTS